MLAQLIIICIFLAIIYFYLCFFLNVLFKLWCLWHEHLSKKYHFDNVILCIAAYISCRYVLRKGEYSHPTVSVVHLCICSNPGYALFFHSHHSLIFFSALPHWQDPGRTLLLHFNLIPSGSLQCTTAVFTAIKATSLTALSVALYRSLGEGQSRFCCSSFFIRPLHVILKHNAVKIRRHSTQQVRDNTQARVLIKYRRRDGGEAEKTIMHKFYFQLQHSTFKCFQLRRILWSDCSDCVGWWMESTVSDAKPELFLQNTKFSFQTYLQER